MAEPMLRNIGKGAIILADRAYDTNALRALAKEKRAWVNIPAKRNRKETFRSAVGSIDSAIWWSGSSTSLNSSEESRKV